MQNNKQHDNWIRSKALLTLLAEHRPDWVRPEFNLRLYLARNMIRAKCRSAEITYRVPHGGFRKETVADWDIRPEVWKGTSLVQPAFGLSDDVLASPVEGLDFRNVLCVGLSFALSDVLDACEIDMVTSDAESASSEHESTNDQTEALALPQWYGKQQMEDIEYYHEIARTIRQGLANSFLPVAREIVEREFKDMDPGWKDSRARHIYNNARLIYQDDGYPRPQCDR